MRQDRRGRNTRALWGSILLALVYGWLVAYFDSLTGSMMIDGVLGVLLGLYICSHPAANAVDLLFLGRGALRRFSTGWGDLGWLGLNLLALLAGWLLIVIGSTRFVR